MKMWYTFSNERDEGGHESLTVTRKDCTVDFREETRGCGYGLFAEGTENLRVVVEN